MTHFINFLNKEGIPPLPAFLFFVLYSIVILGTVPLTLVILNITLNLQKLTILIDHIIDRDKQRDIDISQLYDKYDKLRDGVK